jgi:transposase
MRTEEVPWARPGARLSRDLEDLIAFCAQRMDKTTVARLLRVSWASVARAVVRVVADHLDAARLDGLYRMGVDEVSYRKGHRYLTGVADHDRDGAVVWAAEGRDAATLSRFFDALGPERTKELEAISTDMGAAYARAIDDARRTRGLDAAVCIDPFHVIKLANGAIDACRREAWNQARRQGADARWIKHTRWALVKDPGTLTTSQRLVLEELRRSRSVLHRASQLKEALEGGAARRLPGAVLRRRPPAPRSVARPGMSLEDPVVREALPHDPRPPRGHPHGRRARASNSKLEGLNSKIRLINHRGYGRHSAAAVIAMIYLCCGGITVELPTER